MLNGKWNVDEIKDQTGKVVVITGATSGIGLEAARELARKSARVILAIRNLEKGRDAGKDIMGEVPEAQLDVMELDLASLKSVRSFAADFKDRYDRLDILLNNAGIMMVPYGLTEDGFELQFGTNHLGHFALTGLLMDRILGTQGARVVNVSSNAHYGGEVDFSNLQFEKGEYSPTAAYGRSKLANLLFTYELQRRFDLGGHDALALAAHPGISATGLANHFVPGWLTWMVQNTMKLFFQSSAMGALPSLRAAVDPEALGGQYFGPDGKGERSGHPVVVDSTTAARDPEDAQKLWEISEELTGVDYLK
jgi:NAD(P)-dependent dehydrogenase (short-subunit alcohol dehydrogenase family)